MKEKIIEKIKKALALANNNKNPNEAEAAMLMAQKMMAKYHIEMQEVEEAEEPEIQQDGVEIKKGSWRKSLMKLICNNYRCDCYIQGVGGKKIIIVGAKEDIEIAKTIYEFAENQLTDGFNKYFENNYTEYTSIQVKNAVRKDYADGFIRGLNEKFEKQKQEEIKENQQYALVLTNTKVEEFMDNLNIKGHYKSKDNNFFTDPYAYINGRDKGLNMQDLHSCIEEGNQNGRKENL